MTELTKQDKEVLDKTAQEWEYKNWEALGADCLCGHDIGDFRDFAEQLTINSRQATEERCLKEIENVVSCDRDIYKELKNRLRIGEKK